MRFCPNCGQQIEDAGVFCPNCGQNIEASQENVQPEPIITPVLQPQPVYQPSQPSQPEPLFYTAPSQGTGLNQAILALKRTVTSAPSIIGAVLFTVSAVLSVIMSVLSSSAFYDAANYFLNELDVTISANVALSVVSSVISSLPAFLVILGLWLTIGAAGNKNNDRMSTAGLTIIKVIQIIGLIGMCVSFAALFLLFFILIVFSGYASSVSFLTETYSTPAILLLFFILVGIFVFALIFCIKVLKTIGAAKKVAATGTPNSGASGFVAVILFMIGGAGILSALTMIFGISLLQEMFNYSDAVVVLISSFGLFGGITSLLLSLSYIFFGITIFKFKGAMNRVSRN